VSKINTTTWYSFEGAIWGVEQRDARSYIYLTKIGTPKSDFPVSTIIVHYSQLLLSGKPLADNPKFNENYGGAFTFMSNAEIVTLLQMLRKEGKKIKEIRY
jgi:hypothetical protein